EPGRLEGLSAWLGYTTRAGRVRNWPPVRQGPAAPSPICVPRRPVIVLRGIGLRRHNKHWPPTVKHPLLGPLAALASGILVYRFVPLGPSESLGAIGGFFVLGCLALWRGSRALASVCCLLGLFFAGALDLRVHAPGAPPEIDASGR